MTDESKSLTIDPGFSGFKRSLPGESSMSLELTITNMSNRPLHRWGKLRFRGILSNGKICHNFELNFFWRSQHSTCSAARVYVCVISQTACSLPDVSALSQGFLDHLKHEFSPYKCILILPQRAAGAFLITHSTLRSHADSLACGEKSHVPWPTEHKQHYFGADKIGLGLTGARGCGEETRVGRGANKELSKPWEKECHKEIHWLVCSSVGQTWTGSLTASVRLSTTGTFHISSWQTMT